MPFPKATDPILNNDNPIFPTSECKFHEKTATAITAAVTTAMDNQVFLDVGRRSVCDRETDRIAGWRNNAPKTKAVSTIETALTLKSIAENATNAIKASASAFQSAASKIERYVDHDADNQRLQPRK